MLNLARQPSARRRFRRRLTCEAVGQFVLDIGQHVLVAVAPADVEQHEAVQRVAVARRVDLGVHDVEAGTAEETDHAGEQVALVERVGHDFDAVAVDVDARLDDRLVAVKTIVQGARVPADLFGGMAQKVNRVQLVPQAFVCIFGNREIAQQAQSLFLPFLDDALRNRRLAA